MVIGLVALTLVVIMFMNELSKRKVVVIFNMLEKMSQ